MANNFKLTGNTEAKFKKLENILPRIFKRLNTKTIGIIPASLLHTYIPSVPDSGLIFRACLFQGRIKKLGFRIINITGKDVPKYKCKIISDDTERVFLFQSKKRGLVETLNIDVADGDYIELFQINPEEVVLTDIHISVLFNAKQELNDIHEVMTKDLLKDEEYERI